MRVVTYEETLRALNEAVRDKGYNHVYQRPDGGYCYNVWEGEPHCIVGHVLVRLGVPVEWFEKDNRNIDDVGDVCKNLFLQGLFEFEEEARDLLGDAQVFQDSGDTWGVSVTRAHLGDDWFHALHLHRNAA